MVLQDPETSFLVYIVQFILGEREQKSWRAPLVSKHDATASVVLAHCMTEPLGVVSELEKNQTVSLSATNSTKTGENCRHELQVGVVAEEIGSAKGIGTQ